MYPLIGANLVGPWPWIKIDPENTSRGVEASEKTYTYRSLLHLKSYWSYHPRSWSLHVPRESKQQALPRIIQTLWTLVAHLTLKLTSLNTGRPKISADSRMYRGGNVGFGELVLKSQWPVSCFEYGSLENGVFLILLQYCEKSEYEGWSERDLCLVTASVRSSQMQCSLALFFSAKTSRSIASEVDRFWVLEGRNSRRGVRDNREVDAPVGISSMRPSWWITNS